MQSDPRADSLCCDQEMRAPCRALKLLLSKAEVVPWPQAGVRILTRGGGLSRLQPTASRSHQDCALWAVRHNCLSQNQPCSVRGCYVLQSGWHAH